MFNISKEKKQKFTRVVVFWMVIGMAMAYVPLLFVSDDSTSQSQPPSQEASLPAGVQSQTREATIVTTATSTPTSTKPKAEGFQGLTEEGKTLDDLNKQLGQ